MIEAVVSAGVALVSGIVVLTNRLHTKIGEVDSRIDGVELRVAQNYLSKQEFANALERVETHMVRIEDKLDKFLTYGNYGNPK
jgi:hypothetical protein